MVATSYDGALARLLAHEGGYSNHPADPGGPTNFGITLADYRKYVRPDADAAAVRAMKVAEAKAIYRAKYWDALRGDDLPAGVDYAVFDYGVNSGIGRAGKVLRRVLGLPSSSSAVTATVIAAARARDAREVVAAICDERLAFLKTLRTWPTFGKGWSRRVAEVRAAALALAAPARRPVPERAAARAGSIAVGGTIAAGTAAASQAGSATAFFVILAITGLAALAAVLVWRWWQRRQAPIGQGGTHGLG